MSFIQRELNRIREQLKKGENFPEYDNLYAAQQALSWAIEPDGYKPPYDLVMSTQASSKGCLSFGHPLPSSSICSHEDLQQQ